MGFTAGLWKWEQKVMPQAFTGMILPKEISGKGSFSLPLVLTHPAYSWIIAQPSQSIEIMMTLMCILHPVTKPPSRPRGFQLWLKAHKFSPPSLCWKGRRCREGPMGNGAIGIHFLLQHPKISSLGNYNALTVILKNVMKNVHKHVSESLCVNETFL